MCGRRDVGVTSLHHHLSLWEERQTLKKMDEGKYAKKFLQKVYR
jgi:hypothetical protein